MRSKFHFPTLPDHPSLRDLIRAMKPFEALAGLIRLSDVDFLRYAYGFLKCIRGTTQKMLDEPPSPWSTDPSRSGFLTFQNFAEDVIENVQAVHQLLFQGALQSASSVPEHALLTQLKMTIQKLELSLEELARYLEASTAEPEDQDPFSAYIDQLVERSNGKTANYE